MSVCVLGSANQDLVLRVTDLPKPGETVLARSTSVHLGGKGANQAVAAGRMGAPVTFAGSTGTDDAGRWLRERLSEARVDITYLAALADAPSGQAYIMLSDRGENSIVVVGGANLAMRPTDLSDAAVKGHKVYLAQLETPPEVIGALFSHPDAVSGIRVLNAAPAVPEGRLLFHLADILIVNETELAAYAGMAEPGEAAGDFIDHARHLITRPDQSVVVTLGAAGLAIVGKDGVTRIPGRSVEVVDTTGAGDCFCGVLAAELAHGVPLEAASHFANAAAALAVTRLGASTSAPTRLEVEAFLAAPD
jgi:ribokinase